MDKKKVKSSYHHQDRLWDPKHPKHGLPIEGCKYIIENPVSIIEQENGRYLYVGEYLNDSHEVIVSSTTSAVVEVDRVVTAYTTEENYYCLQDWSLRK